MGIVSALVKIKRLFGPFTDRADLVNALGSPKIESTNASVGGEHLADCHSEVHAGWR